MANRLAVRHFLCTFAPDNGMSAASELTLGIAQNTFWLCTRLIAPLSLTDGRLRVSLVLKGAVAKVPCPHSSRWSTPCDSYS